MPEFDLIRRLQRRIRLPSGEGSPECVLGIGDDGAVLEIPAGRQLVVTTDTLVEGVHFPPETCPEAVGHKALAVNLSDLAAMGARPAWFFMALTLPREDNDWLDAYCAGLAGLAGEARIRLAGGDLSSGPLSITITALGLVEAGRALTRSGAAPGDRVAVSGAPGAAAHALMRLQAGEEPAPQDRAAMEFPAPRLDLGLKLKGVASACIDLSDGLAADLGHILEQSQVGAELDLGRLPRPASLEGRAEEECWPLQLSGGDDYELCFTLPPSRLSALETLAQSCGLRLTVVGRITGEPGLRLLTPDGTPWRAPRSGYRHFDDHQDDRS